METTQANAPAPAQVQTPVHPVHQETETLNALTNWVSQSVDNDPHEGTDLELPKAPKAEEAEQKAAKTEEKTEEKKEEGEQIELPEDEPLFEIEYKTETGKEIKSLVSRIFGKAI
jgi:hypothetical protein